MKDYSYYMNIALQVAEGSTCTRKKVGCVLVDGYGRIISTGFNGAPSGFEHCTEIGCQVPKGVSARKSYTCVSVHAEINALLYAPVREVVQCYCTVLPCFNCLKTLLNTSCGVLYYKESHAEEEEILRLWKQASKGYYKL